MGIKVFLGNDVDCCEIPECSVKVAAPGGEVMNCADYCIVPELRILWQKGIKTLCSCCGHGQDERAYIRVTADCAGKMLALGYKPYEPHECVMHPDSASFHSIRIEEERLKGGPYEKADINEVKARWKKAANYGG